MPQRDGTGTSVPTDSSVYYSSHYWNDLPRVLEYINERTTGDRGTYWMEDFRARFCQAQPFQHGLFVACGNGWVERDFIDRGIVRRATGFDYSKDLLAAAERDRGEREIDYFQADVNRLDLPEDGYDLVVNVGALHHVQYVNRFSRVLCSTLRSSGALVAFDYIGPGRNQYGVDHWSLIRQANQDLPRFLRKDKLKRPHLPTMLHDDPTEAIHADIVLEALARFFTIEERHDVGGGIAYEVITHNPKFFGGVAEAELTPNLDRLLAADAGMTDRGTVPPLFSYYIARPNKAALEDAGLDMHQAAEDSREAWAAGHAGVYSWPQYVEVLLNHAGWGMVRKLARSRPGRALRQRLQR
jgi:SAM-dependent methyltransferase